MTGIVRPSRGHLNKVTKPSSPSSGRRPNHQLLAATAAAAGIAESRRQQQQQDQGSSAIPPGLDLSDPSQLLPQEPVLSPELGDGPLPPHDPMVDLRVAAEDALRPEHGGVAVPQDHEHAHDDHDHDHDHGIAAKAVDMDPAVTHSMDLSTAANILANGGNLLDPSGSNARDYGSPPQGGHDEHDPGDDGNVPLHHNHHHHHHHQHGSHHNLHQVQVPTQHHGVDFGPQERTTEQLARESGYHGVVLESALAKRLAREPAQRPAQQRRPDQNLNLARRSNVEALFAHIAGEEVSQPCKNCHKGHGPWTACVVIDGQMCGSCTNCWFNASGARCSFHEARNQQGHPVQQQQPQHQTHNPQHHPLPAAGVLASQDPPAFGVDSPMNLAAAPPDPPPGSIDFTSAVNLSNPTVRYTVERAMAEARTVDVKMHHLMKIELSAKRLALDILAYERIVAEEAKEPAVTEAVAPPPADLGGGEAA